MSAPLFVVETAGLLTTIQDLGRPRHRFAGVPPGGALDRFAAVAANLLVGNEDGAPVLEITVAGPRLVAAGSTVIAVTGGEFVVRINGDEAPGWTALTLDPGDRLDLSERRGGARAYLAAAGGFFGQRWLGSSGTYLLVGRGGHEGRSLQTGDELHAAAAEPPLSVAGRSLPPELRPAYGNELLAVRGPQFNRLEAVSRRRIFEQMFHVKHQSDRMAYRLEADPPLGTRATDLLSFGVAPGCVQVPPSGEPILLLADHQTAGGYPVVAGVAQASLPAAAQLLPGHELRFREVTAAAAVEAWRRLRRGLETLRPS